MKTALYCRKCGTSIDPGLVGHEDGLCHQCRMILAEGYLPEKTGQSVHGRVPEIRAFRIGLWAIFIICAGITLIRIPAFQRAFHAPKPIRVGAYETDARTDACIQNLWQAAKILQERRVPGRELVCPVSGESYKIIKDGNTTLILCPNPEKHRLKNLRLSSKSMVPEVIR